MRLTLMVGTLLALLLGMLLVTPLAHAQSYGPTSASSPYPYFRRLSSSSMSSQASMPAPRSSQAPRSSSSQASMPALVSDPTIGLTIVSDRSEALPGNDILYRITARNISTSDMPRWSVAFFFDQAQMQILDAGGGVRKGDHITFGVPALVPNQEVSFSVRVHLYNNLRSGTLVRTYGSMIWDGTLKPACSRNDVRIIARPPVTGVGDNTAPVEDLRKFLTPIAVDQNGGFLRAVLSLFW